MKRFRSVVRFGLAASLAAAMGCSGDPQAGTATTSQAATTGRHIIKFNNVAQGMAAVQAAGGNVVHDLTAKHQAVAAFIPAAAMAGLQNNPHIDYIEPDYIRKPLAEEVPFGIAMVQADAATGVSYGGSAARKVCIIDTGYDLGHEDLPLNVTSELHPPTGTNTGDPLADGYGHGTHVAGTIAGLANGVGVVGVMPGGNVDLHIIKIFDQEGNWVSGVSDLIVAVDQCVDAGANVINMSLGGGSPSQAEDQAFQAAYAAGVLSIAAAGNDGNTQMSYPASYDSVVSVAAIDSDKNIASFSQQNSAVELAAPGVAVLSTIPTGHGKATSLTVAGNDVAAEPMDGSPEGDLTGKALADCGLGNQGAKKGRGPFNPPDPGACSGASGKICLIQRGDVSFSDKVLNCQNGGGVGAVIYNNATDANEPLLGTMAGVETAIPSVGVSRAAGEAMSAGDSADLFIGPSGYDYAAWNGTSMATPHVVGVAALIWSHNPSWTNQQVRDAMTATADDLGAAGRDNAFGYGLVQTADALCYLDAQYCGPACVSDCVDQCSPEVIDNCGDACDADVTCTSDNDCASNEVCEGTGCDSACVCQPTCDGLCGQSDGCGGTCASDDASTCGMCGNATPECSGDGDCGVNEVCGGTGCDTTCDSTLLPKGAVCTTDSQCASNKCKGGSTKTCK